MTEFYPNVLSHQLKIYVINVQSGPKFAKLKGLSDLCVKYVETNKCNTFAKGYNLLKLALLLPVARASVERVFSAIKVVKSLRCNKMGNKWLNDRLVTFIEIYFLLTISNNVILVRIQKMDRRRFSLQCIVSNDIIFYF